MFGNQTKFEYDIEGKLSVDIVQIKDLKNDDGKNFEQKEKDVTTLKKRRNFANMIERKANDKLKVADNETYFRKSNPFASESPHSCLKKTQKSCFNCKAVMLIFKLF